MHGLLGSLQLAVREARSDIVNGNTDIARAMLSLIDKQLGVVIEVVNTPPDQVDFSVLDDVHRDRT